MIIWFWVFLVHTAFFADGSMATTSHCGAGLIVGNAVVLNVCLANDADGYAI